MRRIIPLSIALALAGTTLVAGASSNASELAAKKAVETDFGMTATSYGTRVIGGAVPVDSSQTASQSLSCTNKAGVNKSNHIAEVTLDGLGLVQGVTSRTWTEKKGGKVSSNASHDVAHINLFNNALGSLDINGLHAEASAYHDASGFHGKISSKIASITFTPTGGAPMGLDIPTIGKPLLVPGLARISIGVGRTPSNANGAEAVTSVLDIRVLPGAGENEVKAIIGQVKATIDDGIKSGLFYGRAVGAQASVLGDLVTVGQTPLQNMPCKGTEGKPVVKEVAGVNIPPLLEVGAAHAGVIGASNNKKSTATSAAFVASVNIGDGALIINGIRGVASVTRVGGKITRSTEGTVVLEAIFNGTVVNIPLEDLDLPGLVELEENVVERTATGVKVVALRIHLLDGSLAVIDLGTAIVGIKRARR